MNTLCPRRTRSGWSRLDWRWLSLLLFLHLQALPVFAAGGKPATKLVNVADTRALDPGLSRWIADLYNTNLWLFATVVVVIMALMGVILGWGFDGLISKVGIDLGKLDHHE